MNMRNRFLVSFYEGIVSLFAGIKVIYMYVKLGHRVHHIGVGVASSGSPEHARPK